MYPTLEVCPQCNRKSMIYFPLDDMAVRVLCTACGSVWYVRETIDGLVVKKVTN